MSREAAREELVDKTKTQCSCFRHTQRRGQSRRSIDSTIGVDGSKFPRLSVPDESGRAPGDIAASVADVFAWLFAAAFLTAFVLALIEQRRHANQDANRGRPARDLVSRHLHG
jgi:hypothetical protein